MFKTTRNALLALAVCTVPAAATTVTFDLSSANVTNMKSEFVLTDAATGLTLTVDAKSKVGSFVRNAWTTRHSNGAGITSYAGDDNSVDSRGRNAQGQIERGLFELTFSQEVEVQSVNFSAFKASKASFRTVTDTSGDNKIGTADRANKGFGKKKLVRNAQGSNLGMSDPLTVFGISAFDDRSSWKLATITVNIPGSAAVAPVPLPAGGALLLGGLLGLGYLRKRKA